MHRKSVLSLALALAGAFACGSSGGASGATVATYALSGKVTGAGAAGVTVSLSGPTTWSTTTDASGGYSFAGLADGEYTVRPSKAGHAFAPLNAVVTVHGADATAPDFTAAAAANVYAISGTLSGVAGARVSLSGANTGSAVVDGAGHYAFAGLTNGSYELTPVKLGYAFTPSSLQVTVHGADVAAADFAAITYSISGRVVGTSNATVSLSGPSAATTTTDASGNYAFSGLGNLVYSVAASKNGYMFAPSSAAVAVNGADVTGKDFFVTARSWSFDTPFTDTVAAVWGAAANDVWSVTKGTYTGAMQHWDGRVWSTVQLPFSLSGGPVGMWGAAANDIWLASGFTAAHWNGHAWSPVALPSSLPNTVSNVFGSATDDVWAVGYNGTVAHWDGASWRDFSYTAGTTGITSSALWSGWSGGPDDVWVGGDSALLHWNGSTWTDHSRNADGTPLFSSSVKAFWGTSRDLWAVGGVGYGSLLLHWNGETWTKAAHPGTGSLSAVWGSGPDDVWASGTSLLHWNGVAWQDKTLTADGTWVMTGNAPGLWGFGPNSVIAVGSSGTLLWDGNAWTNVYPTLPMTTYGGVGGSSASDVWAVGAYGNVLHFDGSRWQDRTPRNADGTKLTTQTLRGIWASGPGDAWATGGVTDGAATILHWDGTSWADVSRDGAGTAISTQALVSLWGSAANDVWAVGNSGTILHWNGTAWTNFSLDAEGARLTSDQLRCVFGLAADKVWAVGRSTLLRWDGTAWTRDTTPFTQVSGLQASSIWGTSAADLWIMGTVGNQGGAHFDGTSWRNANVPVPGTSSSFGPVWGTGPNDVWVGWPLGLYHWDGTAWSQLAMPTYVLGLWGTGGRMFAVGSTIYQLQ